MRSYHQYCAVARSLDAVGDRWVLLIVRELLALGPSRYSDLRRGLPGIATNLLADRLRTMEADGLIERHDAPPPVGTALFRLTPRGRALQDVLLALTRWGTDRMTDGPAPGDAVRPQWAALLGGLTLPARMPPGTALVLALTTTEPDGEPDTNPATDAPPETLRVALTADGFTIDRGPAPDADLALAGPAHLVGAVLAGRLDPDRAAALGLRVTGAPDLLTDLLNDAAHHRA